MHINRHSRFSSKLNGENVGLQRGLADPLIHKKCLLHDGITSSVHGIKTPNPPANYCVCLSLHLAVVNRNISWIRPTCTQYEIWL